MVIYFLLAIKVGEGCDFQEAFGSYLFWNAGIQLATAPCLAWVTDRFCSQRQARVLLTGSLCMELSMELLLMLRSSYSLNELLLLQLARSVAHTQNYNSVWKLFKHKVEHRRRHSGVSLGEEKDVFGAVGILGIVGEVCIDVIIFTTAYGLVRRGWSLNDVAWFLYSSTWTVSSSAVLFSLSITADYLEGVDGLVAAEDAPLLHPVGNSSRSSSSSSSSGGGGGGGHSHSHSRSHSRSRSNSTSSSSSSGSTNGKSGVVGTTDLEDVDVGALLASSEEEVMRSIHDDPVGYLYGALSAIFVKNPLSFGTLLHAFLLYLMYQLMTNAEPLALANDNVSKTKTLDNLCGGEFNHLFLQAVFTNSIYFVLGLVFVFVLLRVQPLLYYRKIFPVLGAVFLALIVPFYFHVDSFALKAVLAAVLAVIPWFLWRYDTLICFSCVPEGYLGVLTGIISLIRYVSPVLPGLLLKFDQEWLILLLAMCFVVSATLYSVYFSTRYAAQLSMLST